MSSVLDSLRRDFGGDIIEPGEAGYEAASRSVLASGSPAYVLRPKSAGDVQAGVRFAAETGLVLSVRGGGHGFPGFGTNDGGVVIDLSMLAHVEIIDSERHLVRTGTTRPGQPRPAAPGPRTGPRPARANRRAGRRAPGAAGRDHPPGRSGPAPRPRACP